jgi:hypothetical protein
MRFRFFSLTVMAFAPFLAPGCDDRASPERFPQKDRVAPEIVSRCPAEGGSLDDGLCDEALASVEFSEPMDEASIASSFRLLDAGTPLRGRVTYSPKFNEQFQPSGAVARLYAVDLLQPGRAYGASIDGALDLAGNPLPATQWTFQSGTGAELAASTPYDGETGVGKRPRIHLLFSAPLGEPIDPAALALAPAGGAAVDASYTWVPRFYAVRVEPRTPLAADTSYELRVLTALGDRAGRALVAPATVRFRTSSGPDATPPSTPAGLAAAARTVAQGGGFRLTWTASIDDMTAAAELRYRVYISARADPEQPLALAETAPGAVEYATLAAPGTFAVVRALDAAGNESGPAGPVELVP